MAFIAQDDPLAASMFIQQFLDAFKLLVVSPRMGRMRPELGEDMRVHVHGRYLILYSEKDEWVHINRVIHGARDLRSALGE